MEDRTSRAASKHGIVAGLGVLCILGGSLLLAALTGGDGGDSFGDIFGYAISVSSIVLGLGLTIAAATTYLASRE